MRPYFLSTVGMLALGWLPMPAAAAELAPPTEVPAPRPTDGLSGDEIAPQLKEQSPPPFISSELSCPPGYGASCQCQNCQCYSCEQCLGPTPSGMRIIGGVGVYYMQPQFDHNPAYNRFAVAPDGSITAASTKFFDWDLEAAPLVWFGAINENGNGGRVRYWTFDHSVSTALVNDDQTGSVLIQSPVIDGLGFESFAPFRLGKVGGGIDFLDFENSIDLRVVDLEAIKEIKGSKWAFLFGGGARYARLEQSYQGILIDPPTGDQGNQDEQDFVNPTPMPPQLSPIPGCLPPGLPNRPRDPKKCESLDEAVFIAQQAGIAGTGPAFTSASQVILTEDVDVLRTERIFEGVGPTMFVEARRCVGQTGLVLFANARMSVLFGEHRQKTTLQNRLVGSIINTAGDDIPIDINVNRTVRSQEDAVVSVLELEAGPEWSTTLGRSRAFVQVPLVYQDWFDAGSATSDRGDLGFFGLSVRAGLHY